MLLAGPALACLDEACAFDFQGRRVAGTESSTERDTRIQVPVLGEAYAKCRVPKTHHAVASASVGKTTRIKEGIMPP